MARIGRFVAEPVSLTVMLPARITCMAQPKTHMDWFHAGIRASQPSHRPMLAVAMPTSSQHSMRWNLAVQCAIVDDPASQCHSYCSHERQNWHAGRQFPAHCRPQ